jgi:hypothetical protein
VKLNLSGRCVVCNLMLTKRDYDNQRVVAAVGPEGTVVCCIKHLTEDGPTGPKYRNAVRLIAESKAKQLLASPVT